MSLTSVKIEGKKMDIVPGTPLQDVLVLYDLDLGENGNPVALAVVNGQRTCLNEPLWGGENVGLIRLDHPKIQSSMERTLLAVAAIACDELWSESALIVDFSYGGGYYCHLDREEPASKQDIKDLNQRMKETVARNQKMTPRVFGRRVLIRMMRNSPQRYSRNASQHIATSQISLCQVDDSDLLFDGLHLPSTGMIKTWKIVGEDPGFIIMPSKPRRPTVVKNHHPQPKLLETMRRNADWYQQQGISDLGSINRMVEMGQTKELIRTCETRHVQFIVDAAHKVCDLPDDGRLVLVAGPSSSGKTTITKRLSEQLNVLGQKPFMLSLDDYFVDREDTPKDSKGNFDFESLDALKLELLNEHLVTLMNGGEVFLPKFDFISGTSSRSEEPVTLPKGSPLIIEGIHALNPELAVGVSRENTMRIYVSALCHTNLDNLTCMSTTQTRLLRRIVRDAKFRGYTASETLQRWPSVRDGEDRYIFPYQQNADLFFNSGLAYELSVLKLWAEPRLAAVGPEDPAYDSARSYLEFLGWFLPIDAGQVPPTSLLREFIGGSGFSY
jgi:uridine kinase